MISFDEFSKIMERDCCMAWRTVLGEHVAETVDSTVFTMQEKDGRWVYSFAVRSEGRWRQGKADIEPVEYDVLAPNGDGQNRSPENIASDLSFEILDEIAGRTDGWDGR